MGITVRVRTVNLAVDNTVEKHEPRIRGAWACACALGAQNGVGLVELRDQEGGLCASERGGRPTLGLAALLGVSAILMPRSWGLAMSRVVARRPRYMWDREGR